MKLIAFELGFLCAGPGIELEDGKLVLEAGNASVFGTFTKWKLLVLIKCSSGKNVRTRHNIT